MIWEADGTKFYDLCKDVTWLCGSGCGTSIQGHGGDPSRYQWHSEDCSCPIPSFAEVKAAADTSPSPPAPLAPPLPTPPPAPPAPPPAPPALPPYPPGTYDGFAAFWHDPLDYYEARANCSARGGVLASPATAEQLQRFTDAFQTIPSDWYDQWQLRLDPNYDVGTTGSYLQKKSAIFGLTDIHEERYTNRSGWRYRIHVHGILLRRGIHKIFSQCCAERPQCKTGVLRVRWR